MPFFNKREVVVKDHSTKDIITGLKEVYKDHGRDYDNCADLFWQGDVKSTAKLLFDFLRGHVEYEVESPELQTLKTGGAILQDSKGDCKHYASWVVGVCQSLRRQGRPIDAKMRFVADEPGRTVHHVFAVVQGDGQEYWVDPVKNMYFNARPQFHNIKDINMALVKISGTKVVPAVDPRGKLVLTRMDDRYMYGYISPDRSGFIGGNPPSKTDDTGSAMVPSATPNRAAPFANGFHWNSFQNQKDASGKLLYGWWRNGKGNPPKGLDDVGQPLVPGATPSRNPPWTGGWHWDDFGKTKNAQGQPLYGWFRDWSYSGIAKVANDAGKAVQKAADVVKKDVNQAVTAVKKGVDSAITAAKQVILKVAEAPVRNAFLGLLAINGFNIAKRLALGWAKNRQNVLTVWNQNGGDSQHLIDAINNGLKRAKGNTPSIHGYNHYGYIGIAGVDDAGLLALAGALIETLKKYFGVDASSPTDDADMLAGAKQGLANLVGNASVTAQTVLNPDGTATVTVSDVSSAFPGLAPVLTPTTGGVPYTAFTPGNGTTQQGNPADVAAADTTAAAAATPGTDTSIVQAPANTVTAVAKDVSRDVMKDFITPVFDKAKIIWRDYKTPIIFVGVGIIAFKVMTRKKRKKRR